MTQIYMGKNKDKDSNLSKVKDFFSISDELLDKIRTKDEDLTFKQQRERNHPVKERIMDEVKRIPANSIPDSKNARGGTIVGLYTGSIVLLEKGIVTNDQLSSVSPFLNAVEMTAIGIGAAVVLSVTCVSLNVVKNAAMYMLENYPEKIESKGNVQKEKVSSASRFRNLEERSKAIKQDVKNKSKLKL